ncbi:hypothetical protein EF128_18660 [Escherichia coli]|nr:hypothetical protein [Escherichia coli]EAB7524833.1 hypothetical protein [Escherichia coli]EAC0243590.1 hypothetical protein [Escherichia coli]EEW0418984.1 hypothetical protein [Escherichia coli]EEW3500031.1 hypothetical protein [Escherichia coli]
MPEPDKGSDIRFSPVNKKGPPAARKNTPSKAPADAFCAALFDVICAGCGEDMKKARRSEP